MFVVAGAGNFVNEDQLPSRKCHPPTKKKIHGEWDIIITTPPLYAKSNKNCKVTTCMQQRNMKNKEHVIHFRFHCIDT